MGVSIPGANIGAVVVDKGCAEVIAGAGGYKGFQSGFAPAYQHWKCGCDKS